MARQHPGATAPARNTLSHLQGQLPGFGLQYKGIPRRFKAAIHAVDSSAIALIANCMDWAKHRRRKAAAKLHLRLDLQSFLPACAIIEEASHHDDTRAPALCAGLQAGEIALFDKAYIHFAHLFALAQRGFFWVNRAKDNMAYHVCKKLLKKPSGKILRDDLITLKTPKSKKQYPVKLRRVEMLFAMVRGVIWERLDLEALLKSYGTAGGRYRYRAQPEALYLPGLAPIPHGTA